MTRARATLAFVVAVCVNVDVPHGLGAPAVGQRIPFPGTQAPPRTAQVRPGTATLVGDAIDAGTGRGLGGVLVALSCPGSEDARVMTEPNGGFAFLQVRAGICSVTATKPGYAEGMLGRLRPRGEGRHVETRDRTAQTDLKVRLWKLAAISGVISDAAGDPIVNMPVRILEHVMEAGRARLRQAAQTVTDDRGYYRAGKLLPGSYVVAVISTYTTLPDTIFERYQSGPAAQAELRDAIFSIAPAGRAESLRVGDQVVLSSARGPMPHPSAGGRITAFPSAFLPMLGPTGASMYLVLGAGDERTGNDLTLPAMLTARIAGSLVAEDGTPASLVPLRLFSTITEFAGEGFETAKTLTDEQGRFTFLGVTPGSYTIRALVAPLPGTRHLLGETVVTAPALTMWAAEEVTVGDEDVGVVVPLKTGISFRGAVQFDGIAPKPSAERLERIPVVLEPADRMALREIPPGRVQSDGTFTTNGVPAGRYFVRVGGAPPGWSFRAALVDGRDVSTTGIDVVAGEVSGVRLIFTDRAAEVTGRALAPLGAADADALVVLFPTNDRLWIDWGTNPRHIRAARVDPTGGFSFVSVPPGDYFVAALPDADGATWSDPAMLTLLSRSASKVTVQSGGRYIMSLRTTAVRR
jgi:hypothetical protein